MFDRNAWPVLQQYAAREYDRITLEQWISDMAEYGASEERIEEERRKLNTLPRGFLPNMTAQDKHNAKTKIERERKAARARKDTRTLAQLDIIAQVIT